MIFTVNIAKRIAAFQEGENERIVCGNSGYQIKFTFDAEWSAYTTKTARFIWGNKHHDVEFTGDTVDIPVVTNAKILYVGVYVGEAGVDEKILSSTNVRIQCKPGTRCGDSTPSDSTGAMKTKRQA